MFSVVLATLQEQGWFDTTRCHEKTVFVSQGASLSAVLTRSGSPDTFVKFSDLVDLELEAQRCAAASQVYPDHAPQYVGYARSGALNLLVTRAVEFEAVTLATLDSARASRAIRDGLIRLFERTRSLGSTPLKSAAHDWWWPVRDYYRTQPLRELAEPALDGLAPLLPQLPALAQHGDLVINNLGLRNGRHLVVFDWEDFGSVALPGLDLFTLEYSFGQVAAWARANRKACDSSRVVDSAALEEALGLDPGTASRLRLPCALVFRYLKRNYGPEIQVRLDQYIRALASGEAA